MTCFKNVKKIFQHTWLFLAQIYNERQFLCKWEIFSSVNVVFLMYYFRYLTFLWEDKLLYFLFLWEDMLFLSCIFCFLIILNLVFFYHILKLIISTFSVLSVIIDAFTKWLIKTVLPVLMRNSQSLRNFWVKRWLILYSMFSLYHFSMFRFFIATFNDFNG